MEIARLVLSCHALWCQFDVLRTIFVSSQGRYLHVVLPDSEPPIMIRDTDEETHQDFTRMCELDDATPAVLGTCFTRFFITRSSQGSTRLTLRLSHAQYDNISARVIVQSLRAAFDGEEVSDSPQFADFVRYSIKHGAAGFQHWRSVLRGSTMTKVPSSLVDSDLGWGIEVTKVTPIPIAAESVTPATIFTAACACALAKVAKTSDIVFGRVVYGRAALDHSFQRVVGPYVCYVPVRVTFDGTPSMKKAQAVVQAQYVEGF